MSEKIGNLFIMRTCEKFDTAKMLKCFLNKFELMEAVSCNIKNYICLNKYSAIICVDNSSNEYFEFVNFLFKDAANVVKINCNSNAGSFAEILSIAKKSDYSIIEIAEDDYLKFGEVDFNLISNYNIYTAYRHPDHSKLFRNFFSLFDQRNLHTTVCSFIVNKFTLDKIYNDLLLYGEFSDSQMWLNLTLNRFIYLLWAFKSKIKGVEIATKIKRSCNLRIKINMLPTVSWAHLASDSLPVGYAEVLKCKKVNEFIEYVYK